MPKTVIDREALYEAIFDIVRCIPKGRVTSYGAVAKAAGLKSGARLVGRAMGFTRGKKPKIPYQRVVNSAGILSGDCGGRAEILKKEGIAVRNNKVVDFATRFWDPLKEIDL